MAGAIECLVEALRYTDEEIKAANKALVERRAAVILTEKHLDGYHKDRENLAAALEMVKKRVAP